jgi:outer membrane murein-binding lipoprotein Lpp
MKKAIAAVAIGGALALGLAACGDDDNEPTAEQTYCADLAQLESDVNALLSVDLATVSLDDIEEARDTITDDLAEVSESAEDVGEEQISEVEDSYQNVEEGIDDLSGDETLSEAFEQLSPEVSAFLSSLESLDAVNCDEVEAVTVEE